VPVDISFSACKTQGPMVCHPAAQKIICHTGFLLFWHGTSNCLGCEEYRVCSVLTQHLQLFRVLKHTDSTLCSDMVLTMAWSTNSMFWSVMVLTTVKSSEEHREYVVFWHSTYNGLELWTVQTVCCVLNYGTSTVFVHHDWNEEVSWELKQTATGKTIVDFQDPPI
jgi:hypothetical protein